MDIFFETNSHSFHGRPFFGKDTTRALPQLYIFCRPYYNTFVRNKVLYESTKVLSYFRKYESTFVLSYLRRITCLAWYKVLSYLRRYFRTFVLSKYFRTFVHITCVDIIITQKLSSNPSGQMLCVLYVYSCTRLHVRVQ
jgi:hypothetical protein